MRSIIALLLLGLASPAAAKFSTGDLKPEATWALGGSRGAGSVSRYGSSFHTSLSFAVPVSDLFLFGFEGGGNFQHFRRDQQNFGRTGKEHFDEKINLFQLTSQFKMAFQISDYLDLRPAVGMGFYQVNTFEGCHNRLVGECADHHGRVNVATDNYFGMNYGLQIAFKLGGGFIIGPDVRMHQLLGGGRFNSPAFFTPSMQLTGRF